MINSRGLLQGLVGPFAFVVGGGRRLLIDPNRDQMRRQVQLNGGLI